MKNNVVCAGVWLFMLVFASACATTGKAASSFLPPLPGLVENGTDEKSRNEDIQRALASVGILRMTNPYATPERFEPFGKNVFQVSLAALEQEGCEKSDARLFACAVALSRLHRYIEAMTMYEAVARTSGLYKEARKKAGEMEALGLIERRRVVLAKDNSRTLRDLLMALSGEREWWLAVVSDEGRDEETRSLALEEVERIDAARVAALGRMEQQGELAQAIDGLLAQHGNSKNILSHKLLLVKRLLWQREVLIAGNSQSHNFFADSNEEINRIEERVKTLLESVAAEDGTPEKVEALHLLRAFQASVKRVRP